MFRFLLDILFPQKQRIRELEAMDPSAFAVKVPKTLARAGPGMMSLFDYRDPMIRGAIWELKYRGNKRVATLLATVMYDELLAFLEEYAPLTNFTEPLLVPIPLSKRRERKRGFNQCELLCEEIRRLDSPFPTRLAEASGVAREGSTAVFGRRDFSPFTKWSSNNARGENFTYSPSVLRKVKDTPSQTKSRNKKERMKNLAGCFEASIEVSGRNVILIDDVATTGATLLEARRALRKSGARKVIAFTIAH